MRIKRRRVNGENDTRVTGFPKSPLRGKTNQKENLMRKKMFGVLCIFLLAVLLVGTNLYAGGKQEKAEGGKTEKAQEADVQTSGFTFGGLGKVVHPYWDEVGMGVKNAATVAQCDAIFENPSKEDVARQVTVLEGYIAQGVDGIVFGASDPGAFDKVVSDAMGQDIPVITFDSDAPESGRLVYIGPNNYHSGFLAGQDRKSVV